ncbi:MAG: hypothetical protein JW781_05770 [Deltaproteobacteria bacterium]|nr:hypothetical protein [Candidatus Anaeroferrophillacea bacterium]
MVPEPETCFELLIARRVPVHIVGHSVAVTRAAVLIGTWLNAGREEVRLPLLAAGGLLHDIAKYESITTGDDHARLGGEWMDARGYHSVALVVSQHVRMTPAAAAESRVTEVDVVYYADKRVKHEDVVPLSERFIDLQARYGKTAAARSSLETVEEFTMRLEEKIFRGLSEGPELLGPCLAGERFCRFDEYTALEHRIGTLFKKYIDNYRRL